MTECPKCSMGRSCSTNCHHRPPLVSTEPFTLSMNCCKTHPVAISFPNASFWRHLTSPWVVLLAEWNIEKSFMLSDGPLNEQTYVRFYAASLSTQDLQAGFVVNDYQEILPTSAFKRSFEDIAFDPNELACGLTESSKKYTSLTPNPWRKKSDGRMVYRVPLIIFMDDVSGNISKQWNKHFVIYMSNASLPREMLDQEFNVRFVTSSPHASPMELMHAMKESVM